MARPAPRYVFLLNQAQRAVHKWIEAVPDAWEGASAAQAGLLFLLATRGTVTIGEVAQELQVAPAAVTNLSKRMAAAGLVARVADPLDARVTRLGLTAQGEQAAARARGVLRQLNARLVHGFSADEMAVVARWLDQVGQLGG